MNRRHALIASIWIVAILGVFAVQRLRRPEPTTSALPAAGATRVERSVPVALATSAAPRMLHGDRRHRARTTLVGPAAPTLAWSVTAGAPVVAQPVVDPRGRLVVGSLDRFLYVIDIRTGALAWRKDLDGPIYGSALVLEDGTILVGSDAQALHVLSPTGDVLYRIATVGDADTSPVLASDGTIRFCAGSELWSVTKRGEVRFRFRAGAKIFSSPLVLDDGVTVFGSQDDHVYGVAANGDEVFRFRTGGDVSSSPTLADDGTLLVGSDDGNVYALDIDGRLKWKLEIGAMVRAPLSTSGDLVYVGTLGPRPRVLAVEVATARVRFEFELTLSDESEVGVMSGVLVDANGALYFGGHDDFLYSIDSRGHLRWAFPTHGDIDGTPALVGDGAMAFGSEDGLIRLVSSRAPAATR
jgi:outer membrane protein assembly factor BamB